MVRRANVFLFGLLFEESLMGAVEAAVPIEKMSDVVAMIRELPALPRDHGREPEFPSPLVLFSVPAMVASSSGVEYPYSTLQQATSTGAGLFYVNGSQPLYLRGRFSSGWA